MIPLPARMPPSTETSPTPVAEPVLLVTVERAARNHRAIPVSVSGGESEGAAPYFDKLSTMFLR